MQRRNRAASKFIVAALIALGSISLAAPVASAQDVDCNRTVVHKLVCLLVDPGSIDRVKDVLCLVSQDLCT